MRTARTRRTLVAAVSMAAAVAVATPVAHAAPASPDAGAAASDQDLPIPAETPQVNQHELDSLGAFAPALIGSVATRDANGNVNEKLLSDARSMADNPALPVEVQQTWRSLIDFLGEPGKAEAAKVMAADDQYVGETDAAKKKGGPAIPKGKRAPRIQQFLYPTVGFGCMPGGGNSVGMALATAGPQKAPAPGPKRGQAGFVYTSLGTGPAKKSPRALWVSWLNLENGRTGQQRLMPNPKINATNGPGTFTAIATTGRGRIVATIYGDVTTKTKGRTVSCGIAPTIGTAII
ncbi:MAG: hypothetical protein QM774_00810 [Gordonia sp. (in: high G+C Gram-positive bacteria)]|uniref:Rv1157c family protein n=1 Tax=Gordonia sp. (in: high G+C Gram-positive bacteria) TaxID=84139 RepID=UPI0039E5AE9D